MFGQIIGLDQTDNFLPWQQFISNDGGPSSGGLTGHSRTSGIQECEPSAMRT